MCGIAGFWQQPFLMEHPPVVLSRMAAAVSHRGPDDSGVFLDAPAGLGLAFSRLAIVDLSVEGHQPMQSASGRYVIVFNGEIYNYECIRRELGRYVWRGHSDTEVILEAIERWGMEVALRKFVGMFAFALWDRGENQIFLCRDRLGIKPLYYGKVNSTFVFASELKAVAQVPGFDPEIDRDVLALYMRHNYVPTPHCIYRGLHKLEPGCILRIGSASGTPELRRFWSAREVAMEGSRAAGRWSEAGAIQQLQEKLSAAVRLRMVADVPVGAFLSGGVDSSTVVALMQSQSSRPIKTFTVGLREDEYDESAVAANVAKHLGTDHTELLVTSKEAMEVVPLLARMYDEPFADSSQIPTYLVSKLARQTVTVSLSGDGGDEIFGGYTRHIFASRAWNTLTRTPAPLRPVVASLLRRVPRWTSAPAIQFLRPLMRKALGVSAVGDKAQKLAEVWTSTSVNDLYGQLLSQWKNPGELIRGSSEPRTLLDSIAITSQSLNFQEMMMLTDLMHYLPDDILTKLDRASMAAGLEARVPLLDHRVVEFAWQLPLAFKIREGTGKWILREVLAKFLPRKLMDRPKMGFAIPLDRWLRGPLRDWAEDLLSPAKLSQYELLNGELVQQKWQEHQRGIHNWSDALWSVLVFQDWMANHGAAVDLKSATPVICASC
jgi:asparagine synthase (glutamine-hydrolysing)